MNISNECPLASYDVPRGANLTFQEAQLMLLDATLNLLQLKGVNG